jgi:uncharacterized membrane protein
MKTLFSWGLVCVVVGLLSLLVTFPHAQPEAFQSDSITLGKSQQANRPMPSLVGGILIVGGLGMMVGGCRERHS